ncbi:SDR family NAD(P)-dependent oxidoreductase [uncultured Mycolicibacterium sp.]|uniref:SDR family NAD(P)-dependent oxidoreductase n=1 Tax=uncultured Mycolicibacterium sp. TaxID=2320817 RepID=UPI00263908D0|nr:SDR family oxidoreductase [uncultured Mycolicibacterium sp.]
MAVVVAGGSSGIGLASALAFVDAGVRRLALLSLNPERGQAARALVAQRAENVQVTHIAMDANDPDQVQAAIDHAHETLGSIDVLVNSVSAPAYRPELLKDIPIDDIIDTLTKQAGPPMLLTRAVFPIMSSNGGGSIINVASDAAKIATPGESVLGAAMAAIVMFTRTAAIEGKRNGIRVNALTPSLISGTPTTERALKEGFSKKLFEKAAAQAHLGLPSPEDQAQMVVFLGGPGAARLTGQAISITGGIAAA